MTERRDATVCKAYRTRLERGLEFVAQESAAVARADPTQRRGLETRAQRLAREQDLEMG